MITSSLPVTLREWFGGSWHRLWGFTKTGGQELLERRCEEDGSGGGSSLLKACNNFAKPDADAADQGSLRSHSYWPSLMRSEDDDLRLLLLENCCFLCCLVSAVPLWV